MGLMASPSGLSLFAGVSLFAEELGCGLELILLRFLLGGESPLRCLSVELGPLTVIKRGMDIHPDACVGATESGRSRGRGVGQSQLDQNRFEPSNPTVSRSRRKGPNAQPEKHDEGANHSSKGMPSHRPNRLGNAVEDTFFPVVDEGIQVYGNRLSGKCLRLAGDGFGGMSPDRACDLDWGSYRRSGLAFGGYEPVHCGARIFLSGLVRVMRLLHVPQRRPLALQPVPRNRRQARQAAIPAK